MANINASTPTETKMSKASYDFELTSLKLAHRNLAEFDHLDGRSTAGGKFAYIVPYWNVVSGTISIIIRPCVIAMNWYLALGYYHLGAYAHSAWTVCSILLPMSVTMFIYYIMLCQDEKVIKCDFKVWKQLGLSYLLRDLRSLLYARKCRRAKAQGLRDFQIKYFKLYIIEESDVALLKIFDSFLESAAQKILQISIILSCNKISFPQAISICIYFISIAWCLAAYNRASRLAQIDKHNIGGIGFMLQLAYYLCQTVSRTLCIAFLASLFPLQTFGICSVRVLLSGIVIFSIDRPKFSTSNIFNFFLSLVIGVVYLFTLLPITDTPTRAKYIVFHTVCVLENASCVILYVLHANVAFNAYINLLNILCAIAISLYFIGILLMVIYYKCYHPQIIARNVL